MWKKSKNEGIPSVEKETMLADPNVEYIKWQVHQDWVTDVSVSISLKKMTLCQNLIL